jgi:hypothetical protein
MPKCQKSTAIANSLSAKTRSSLFERLRRTAVYGYSAVGGAVAVAHGGGDGDVNANAVWLLSESESL